MPNGRSGGFGISKERFERILKALPTDAIVGRAIPSGDVDVSTISRMVSEYPEDVIVVEEQDFRWYIIHLEPMAAHPPNAKMWIMVSSESPLFEDLRQQHVTGEK